MEKLEKSEQMNPPEITKSEKDIINLRREARRKKILENAKSRLEKLNVEAESRQFVAQSNVEQFQYPDPEIEPDLIQEQQREPFGGNDLDSLFSSFQTSTVPPASPAKSKHFIFKYRLHVILAAVLAWTIHLFVQGGNSSYSAFIPAALLIGIEIVNFDNRKPLNPIATLIITMCGIKNDRAQRLFNVFSAIQSLGTDLGILVFSFTILSYILMLLNDEYGFLMQIN